MKAEKPIQRQKKFDIPCYALKIQGHGTEPWSAPRPDDVKALVTKPSNTYQEMKNLIVKTEVELLCAEKKTLEAHEILEKYKALPDYRFPLNKWNRDRQDSHAIYQGAHCFYGAFRDACGDLFQPFYEKRGDTTKPSDKHLRRQVKVIPNHIFLLRSGKKLLEGDFIDAQQPVGDVPGFARYEVIEPPFHFEYIMRIMVAGKFRDFLADKKYVIRAIEASTLNGQGSRRSAGFGGWEIDLLKEITWKPWI